MSLDDLGGGLEPAASLHLSPLPYFMSVVSGLFFLVAGIYLAGTAAVYALVPAVAGLWLGFALAWPTLKTMAADAQSFGRGQVMSTIPTTSPIFALVATILGFTNEVYLVTHLLILGVTAFVVTTVQGLVVRTMPEAEVHDIDAWGRALVRLVAPSAATVLALAFYVVQWTQTGPNP